MAKGVLTQEDGGKIKKFLPIESCYDCPKAYYEVRLNSYYCGMNQCLIGKTAGEIPKTCPLPHKLSHLPTDEGMVDAILKGRDFYCDRCEHCFTCKSREGERCKAQIEFADSIIKSLNIPLIQSQARQEGFDEGVKVTTDAADSTYSAQLKNARREEIERIALKIKNMSRLEIGDLYYLRIEAIHQALEQ